MGDAYSIADIATFPWVRNLAGFYGAGDLVGMQDFAHVQRALDSVRGASGGGSWTGHPDARLNRIRSTRHRADINPTAISG